MNNQLHGVHLAELPGKKSLLERPQHWIGQASSDAWEIITLFTRFTFSRAPSEVRWSTGDESNINRYFLFELDFSRPTWSFSEFEIQTLNCGDEQCGSAKENWRFCFRSSAAKFPHQDLSWMRNLPTEISSRLANIRHYPGTVCAKASIGARRFSSWVIGSFGFRTFAEWRSRSKFLCTRTRQRARVKPQTNLVKLLNFFCKSKGWNLNKILIDFFL